MPGKKPGPKPQKPKPIVYCSGSSPDFDPAEQARSADVEAATLARLERDDFAGAVRTWFKLPARDDYVYYAMGSCVLDQVQHVVGLGAENGLHDWYVDEEGKFLPPPPPQDTLAYTALFSPTTTFPAALRSLASNARKHSLRASVAAHLTSKRFIHPSLLPTLSIPRLKPPKSKSKSKPKTSTTTTTIFTSSTQSSTSSSSSSYPNPYLLFQSYASRTLSWAGPCPESNRLNPPKAHHILPILMHHFACACPSHEALSILSVLAAGGRRPIADVGSGAGYWTFCLRARGLTVHAVDSAQSAWRTAWVPDTIVAAGAAWLRQQQQQQQQTKTDGGSSGGADLILLLVYPVVGGGAGGGTDGSFTRDLLDAYDGDTVAVVGTQNRNGYTGFSGMTMDEYMARERPEWTRVVQIPLPSFPGKDEALYVFQRGERAPPPLTEAQEDVASQTAQVEEGRSE